MSYEKFNIGLRVISIILSMGLILNATELYALYTKEDSLSLRKPLDFNTVTNTGRFQNLYTRQKNPPTGPDNTALSSNTKLKERVKTFFSVTAGTGLIMLFFYGIMQIPFRPLPSSWNESRNGQDRVASVVWRDSSVGPSKTIPVIGNSPIFSDVAPEDSAAFVKAAMKILYKTLGDSRVKFQDYSLNLGKITVKFMFDNYIAATKLVKNDSTKDLMNKIWCGMAINRAGYNINDGDSTHVVSDTGGLMINILDNRVYSSHSYQYISIHELMHIALTHIKTGTGVSFDEYLVNLLHDKYGYTFTEAQKIETAIEEFICYDTGIKFAKDIYPAQPYLEGLNNACFWIRLIPNEIFNMLKYDSSEFYNDFIRQGYVKGGIFSKENGEIRIESIEWEDLRSSSAIISQDFVDWERDIIVEDPASFTLRDGKDRLATLNTALDILRSSGFISDKTKEQLKGGILIFEGDITTEYFSENSPEIQVHRDILDMSPNTAALFIARSILRFTGVYNAEKKLGEIERLIDAMDTEALKAARKEFYTKKVFTKTPWFYDGEFFKYILDALDDKIRSGGEKSDSNIPNIRSIKDSLTSI